MNNESYNKKAERVATYLMKLKKKALLYQKYSEPNPNYQQKNKAVTPPSETKGEAEK